MFHVNGEKISNDDLLLTLRKDVESGKLGSLNVDADYFKVIDKGGTNNFERLWFRNVKDREFQPCGTSQLMNVLLTIKPQSVFHH